MASKTGKGGEVSLRLKVERAKNSDTAVLIEAHIAGKSPTEPVGADLLFVDDDGNLHTRNPYQRDAFEDGPAAVS
jgi:hypothetical protein